MGETVYQRTLAAVSHGVNALLFLYKEVLHLPFEHLGSFERPLRRPKVPTVMSRGEVNRLVAVMDGTFALIARLLYGTGMRLMEGLRLRVKDIDFDRGQVVVHDGKGFKDRVTVLPDALREPLKAHLSRVEALHQQDLKMGLGRVWLPGALRVKYPKAEREWMWQRRKFTRMSCRSRDWESKVRWTVFRQLEDRRWKSGASNIQHHMGQRHLSLNPSPHPANGNGTRRGKRFLCPGPSVVKIGTSAVSQRRLRHGLNSGRGPCGRPPAPPTKLYHYQ